MTTEPRQLAEELAGLWPAGPPADEWPDWLVRILTKAIGAGDDRVTLGTAATLLGVSRSTVQTMLTRGALAPHPDGAALRSSVLGEIARRQTGHGRG